MTSGVLITLIICATVIVLVLGSIIIAASFMKADINSGAEKGKADGKKKVVKK